MNRTSGSSSTSRIRFSGIQRSLFPRNDGAVQAQLGKKVQEAVNRIGRRQDSVPEQLGSRCFATEIETLFRNGAACRASLDVGGLPSAGLIRGSRKGLRRIQE